MLSGPCRWGPRASILPPRVDGAAGPARVRLSLRTRPQWTRGFDFALSVLYSYVEERVRRNAHSNAHRSARMPACCGPSPSASRCPPLPRRARWSSQPLPPVPAGTIPLQVQVRNMRREPAELTVRTPDGDLAGAVQPGTVPADSTTDVTIYAPPARGRFESTVRRSTSSGTTCPALFATAVRR